MFTYLSIGHLQGAATMLFHVGFGFGGGLWSSDVGGENWTQTLFLKLFGPKSRDITPISLGFEWRTQLFGPHPFTWKTPTPPEDIQTKELGFLFLPWWCRIYSSKECSHVTDPLLLGMRLFRWFQLHSRLLCWSGPLSFGMEEALAWEWVDPIVADPIAQANDKRNLFCKCVENIWRKFLIEVHRGRGQDFPIFISCRYLVELDNWVYWLLIDTPRSQVT